MTAIASQQSLAVHRVLLTGIVGILAGAAWLALWLLGSSPQGFPIHAHGIGHHHTTWGLGAVLFVGGWMVMTVAMMLPTSLPVLSTFGTIAGQRRDHSLLVALVALGYLVTWMLFGITVYLGSLTLQEFLGGSLWLEQRRWWFGGSLLLLAGVYQFTPLKYRCLEKCRSPLSFVIEHWRGRKERWEAFRLGLHHGGFCVGCCWTLMLLMFAVGFGNLSWMFVLATMMAIEKNVSWGRRLSAPLGVAFLAAGIVALTLA